VAAVPKVPPHKLKKKKNFTQVMDNPGTLLEN
jgi:hypothetical protein